MTAVYSLPTFNIPRVRKGTTPESIKASFHKCNFPEVANVEGGLVEGKNYESYFVSFKPIELSDINPNALALFNALLEGRPCKMWYCEESFWHINLSCYGHHLKTMETVGEEYALWDGIGSYDDFLAKPEPTILFGDFGEEELP
jgi:hypothetical protein